MADFFERNHIDEVKLTKGKKVDIRRAAEKWKIGL